MSQPFRPDSTHQLQNLMQQVGIASFKALARSSGVSERQLLRLRRGEVAQMRMVTILKVSRVLQVPLTQLIATFSQSEFGEQQTTTSQEAGINAGEYAVLRQEYQRLQAQLEQQQQELWQEFQQSSIQLIESWLLQWPTAAHKAQEDPQLPAVRLLPLLRPIELLMQRWGVVAIASVGAELPYEPQIHQLLAGTAQPGDLVKVRYVGYRQGAKLLYRAKVSPI